jgi:hypothetical protein
MISNKVKIYLRHGISFSDKKLFPGRRKVSAVSKIGIHLEQKTEERKKPGWLSPSE